MNQKWEYEIHINSMPEADNLDVLKLQAVEMKAKLNEFGKKGWELMGAGNGIYIFKRQVMPRERGPLGNV